MTEEDENSIYRQLAHLLRSQGDENRPKLVASIIEENGLDCNYFYGESLQDRKTLLQIFLETICFRDHDPEQDSYNLKVLEVLLQKGADVDKTDTSYHARSAVQMAANSCWCSIPIFCRLVEASQCIDKKDREAISLLVRISIVCVLLFVSLCVRACACFLDIPDFAPRSRRYAV
jgi:hypothetical protein